MQQSASNNQGVKSIAHRLQLYWVGDMIVPEIPACLVRAGGGVNITERGEGEAGVCMIGRPECNEGLGFIEFVEECRIWNV
jgi:hypothetical protein